MNSAKNTTITEIRGHESFTFFSALVENKHRTGQKEFQPEKTFSIASNAGPRVEQMGRNCLIYGRPERAAVSER
jgi:hypothetical protein